MEQPEKNFPSPSAQSFAGLLASLAAPEKNGTERATGWDEEELADDLVTLSYEHALRAQATREAGLGESSDAGDPLEKLPHRTRAGEHDHASSASLRTTSVTIRLSHLETARLRRRAAEALVRVGDRRTARAGEGSTRRDEDGSGEYACAYARAVDGMDGTNQKAKMIRKATCRLCAVRP
jgi:hypothetical protein